MLDNLIASVWIVTYDKLLLLCGCTNVLKVRTSADMLQQHTENN